MIILDDEFFSIFFHSFEKEINLARDCGLEACKEGSSPGAGGRVCEHLLVGLLDVPAPLVVVGVAVSTVLGGEGGLVISLHLGLRIIAMEIFLKFATD